jgi:hypothetical protein
MKIFDDYDVDCNECTHYWDSSCDGVPIDKKRNCTSYKATRTVDIPMQIKKLVKRIDRLKALVITLLIIDVILGVMLLK